MMKKLQKMRKDRKGFTLVELIVVLVILAILAAMLVPALLGYIDRAKEGKYEEEVHAIYTALQVIYDEGYAKDTPVADLAAGKFTTTSTILKELNKMVSPTHVVSFSAITPKDDTDHGKYTVAGFTCVFNSQSGDADGLTGKLESGTVTVELPE